MGAAVASQANRHCNNRHCNYRYCNDRYCNDRYCNDRFCVLGKRQRRYFLPEEWIILLRAYLRCMWHSGMVFPYSLSSGGETLDEPRLLSPAVGPRDRCRAERDRTALAGNTLSIQACMEAGVDESMLGRSSQGAKLDFRYVPPVGVLRDYPTVKDRPEVAAEELDRLSSSGKTHWCGEGCAPPDSRVCPSRLIAKGGKVRVVFEGSNHKYGLNGTLLNPPAKSGDMDDFLQLLPPQ